jgi:hypothetical protein
MPDGQGNPDLRDQFAMAMAMGRSVSAWAKQHRVPRRTCHDWKETKEYKLRVQDIRRRAVDRAIGLLARDLTTASGTFARLVKDRKNGTVQLQAARAIFSTYLTTMKQFDMEERMTEIESDIEEHKANNAW